MASSKEVEKLYTSFHGREPRADDEETVELGSLHNLVSLGECTAIEYEAEKKHMGDKKMTLYRHEFDNPINILSNGKIIILTGLIKIDKEGIHG